MKYLSFLVFLALAGFSETQFYRLVWEKDPSTTVTVGCFQPEMKQAVVHYDTVDHGQDVDKYRFKKASTKKTEYKGTHSQFAYLTDLKPDTKYYFVIKDDNSVSKRFYFLTAPNKPKEFRFIAGGDSRSSSKNRQKSNVLVPKIRPLFVLFGGDFTGSGTAKQWTSWLKDWQLTHSSDGRMYPIIPVRGNHDKKGGVASIFGLQDTKEYYSISFAQNSLRVYNLNTEIDMGGQQQAWLKADLEKNAAKSRFLIASYHKPIRPHVRGKREGAGQYKYWAQLFYDYKFDILVEADSHCVKRTAAVKPSTAEGNDEGFVKADDGYVMIGEGCWGAPLRRPDDLKSWTLDAGRFNSFDIIDLRKDRLEIRTVNSDLSKSVVEKKETDPTFSIPEGLKLWEAKSGLVLTVPARQK